MLPISRHSNFWLQVAGQIGRFTPSITALNPRFSVTMPIPLARAMTNFSRPLRPSSRAKILYVRSLALGCYGTEARKQSCRLEHRKRLDMTRDLITKHPPGSICIVWEVDDVKSIRFDLTKAQCAEVLQHCAQARHLFRHQLGCGSRSCRSSIPRIVRRGVENAGAQNLRSPQ